MNQKSLVKDTLFTNEVAKIFFSKSNIKRIQNMIIKEVFVKTKGKFKLETEQDENDLYIVMRAVYLQHANFQAEHIVRQVKQLNAKVLCELLPDMLTAIKQEYGYIQEINKPLQVLPRSMNVSTKGSLLPSITTTFGINHP